jgi:AcrR family transcriptional regulator
MASGRILRKYPVRKRSALVHRGGQAKSPGRRERRHAETRERLMSSALRLFAERGFADTSIEDITEAADVGKGTFFNYFETKEHVLDTFGKQRIAKVEAALAEARSGKKTIQQILRQLAHSHAGESPFTPKLMRSFLVAALLNDSVCRTTTGNQAYGRRVLAEIIAIGQKRGEVRRDISARQVARAMQQGIFGAFLLWALNPDLEISTWLDPWVDVMLFGVVPRGRENARGTPRNSDVPRTKRHTAA